MTFASFVKHRLEAKHSFAQRLVPKLRRKDEILGERIEEEAPELLAEAILRVPE